MRRYLLWKLLLINILPVIGVIILVVWWAIESLAADYFMALMDQYAVSPTETHAMFLSAIHRYLIWATIAAVLLAVLLSFLLTRRVLRPLVEMTEFTRRYAAGDFSGRVQIETHDEVGQLGEAFNRMADSLQGLEQLRKDMTADLAHELRTPLTNLRGYLEGLSDGVVPPTAENFRMLQDEILRLVDLVQNLQQLARADAARAYLQCQTVKLSELVDQMLALYRPNLESRNIQVSTIIGGTANQVNADRDKLLQAIRNLIENACKYTDEGGTFHITLEDRPGFSRLLFTNSGPGILQQDLPLIFERFYRSDPSRSRDVGGAGLGLAIVKELIEAHGGAVGATSQAGETTIWLDIPRES